MNTSIERRKRTALRSMVDYMIRNVYITYHHPTIGLIKAEDSIAAMFKRVRKA